MNNFSSLEQLENALQQTDQQEMTTTGDDIFEECTCCGKAIHYGNAVVEVERTVEQNELNADGLMGITVTDSDVLATICSDCGNRNFVPRKLRRKLAEVLEFNSPEPYMVYPCDGTTAVDTSIDPCSRCGCEIKPGDTQVGLGMMVAQVDWSEPHDDSLLTPIYGESLFTFCASCGNKMSEDLLDEALKQVLVYADRQPEEDDDWFDDLNNEEDTDIDDDPATTDSADPVLGYYSKQAIPGVTASFGNIPDVLKYVTETLIPAGHDYIVNIRGGWEIEANEPSCLQVVPENKVFDNMKLDPVIHMPFAVNGNTTNEFIRFMEFPLYKHFERYYLSGIPCFAFPGRKDTDKLIRVAQMLLVEVFRYTTAANIECNVLDQGALVVHKNAIKPDARDEEIDAALRSYYENVAEDCDCCGADIFYGNPGVRFNRAIQQLIRPLESGGFETVLIEEEMLGIVCASCASRFNNLNTIRRELAALLEMSEIQDLPPEGAAIPPAPQEKHICDDCGGEILPGNAELLIEKEIIQLPAKDSNTEIHISGHELIGVCTLCAGKYSRDRLMRVVQKMIDERGDYAEHLDEDEAQSIGE